MREAFPAHLTGQPRGKTDPIVGLVLLVAIDDHRGVRHSCDKFLDHAHAHGAVADHHHGQRRRRHRVFRNLQCVRCFGHVLLVNGHKKGVQVNRVTRYTWTPLS